MTERRPCTTVRVGHNLDYPDAVDEYGGVFRERWWDVGDMLAHRTGWHCDVVNFGELLWSYGAFGSSLLNVSIDDDGAFSCFDYFADDVEVLATLDDVSRWLDDREPAARDNGRRQIAMLEPDDWWLLRQLTFDVLVSWSDGWFTATVRGLPAEATFAETLPGLLTSSAQMITEAAGAPAEKAGDLKLRAELSIEAVRALLRPA